MDELWKLDKYWLAAYTENKAIMKSIKRYKPHWRIMAEYFSDGRLKALQYKIPMSERRQAERILKNKPI